MFRAKRTVQFLLTLVFTVGCTQAGPQTGPNGSADKGYDIKGTVVEIAADKQAVTLDHEDIPGFMSAMTMEFKVEEPAVVAGVSAGDKVGGQLEVRSGDYVITRLQKQ
jgi:Cu/Ag efflux protein CusF